MKKCLVVLVLFVMGTGMGCTPSSVKEMTKKTWQSNKVKFKELDNVMFYMDPDKPTPAAMSHGEFNRRVTDMDTEIQQTGPQAYDPKSLIKAIKDAGFQERLKALESAAWPSSYGSPERDEARKRYLDEWKALEQKLATSKKFEDVKEASDRLDKYFRQMEFIPGQSPPTGEATKQYSGIEPYEDPYK